MHYHIDHTTLYTYDCPVVLAPHVLRLRPRCDVAQRLHSFDLQVDPKPVQMIQNIDLDGNPILKLWFAEEAIAHLKLRTVSDVETYRTNPFDFLLEPWAIRLPVDYPASLLTQLQPYLDGQFLNTPSALDPAAVHLAQTIWQEAEGNTIAFLTYLNQHIYSTCHYGLREAGEALPPGLTWEQKSGSCRDFAVLFIETCRAMGLAARFVSGYHEGDPKIPESELHAWAEVYLPGAGWRGYDPTYGLAVGDRHIAVVASSAFRQTTPVSGSLKHGTTAKSTMSYDISVQPVDEFASPQPDEAAELK